MSTYTQAALIADALCLGPHWIYDQAQLEQLYPKGVTEFTNPASPYHPNRQAGQHTHLGDQVKYLAECIHTHGGYQDEQWKSYWLAQMAKYDGYLDGATKQTLSTQANTPADSAEFAAVSRIAPVLDLGLGLTEALDTASSQARLTHGASVVAEAAEFFVRAVLAIESGQDIPSALASAALAQEYTQLSPQSALEQAQQADPDDHLAVALEFGQPCSLHNAFPLTLYYALHHADDFISCISKNALAGGDNTARAMVLAVLITARDGDCIPAHLSL